MYWRNDPHTPDDGRLRLRKVSRQTWMIFILACFAYWFMWNDWACTIHNEREFITVCGATVFLVMLMTYVYLFIRYPLQEWIFRRMPPENSFPSTLWRVFQVFWPMGLFLLLAMIADMIWHISN